jgi:NAD(P)-dependent dehydrogenase (short-subunit alcohol dehydrogenase family)
VLIQLPQDTPNEKYFAAVTAVLPHLQKKIETWKSEAQMGRPGQPCEVATCYVFLASEDSSYISGQTLHPNGGTVLNT